jgi:hypothetical protein
MVWSHDDEEYFVNMANVRSTITRSVKLWNAGGTARPSSSEVRR